MCGTLSASTPNGQLPVNTPSKSTIFFLALLMQHEMRGFTECLTASSEGQRRCRRPRRGKEPFSAMVRMGSDAKSAAGIQNMSARAL